MDYYKPRPLPMAIFTDKFAVLAGPRSGSTKLQHEFPDAHIGTFDEWKETNLRRIAILRQPIHRYFSVKRMEKHAEHLKATDWWVPNYCEQLQDVNFEYIMFGEFSDYVGDVKVGTTLTTGVNLNDMIDDEMMRPEMDAYHKLITTRQKISVKDWRDLCK